MVVLLFAIACNNPNKTTRQENKIFASVLQNLKPEDGYTLVWQNTELFASKAWDDEISRTKWLKENEIPADLLDRLIENNTREVAIGLKSAFNRGYLVDKKGDFKKYCPDNSSCDWKRLGKDRPNFASFTFLSRPAYSEKTGLIMLYFAQLRGPYDGEGFIIIYKYDGDTLEEIKRVAVWIS